jgi:putative membrane protein
VKRPDWQTEGQEPDYRFTLANERTFLAWIRTALALLAGGVALDQFVGPVAPRTVVAAIAAGLILLAAFLAAMSYFRWKGIEIAMRRAGPLPSSIGMPLLSAVLGGVALLLMVLLVAAP